MSLNEVRDIFKGLLDGRPQIPSNRVKSLEARDWFRKTIRNKLGGVQPKDILALKNRIAPSVFIGKMFLYVYDPKTKERLPYYDAFPLVIPIEMYKDGFLGLNLHYIPREERAFLLYKLLTFATDKRLDENTKLMVSYGFLKGVSRFKAAEPCIKRYLNSHIQSHIIQIDAPDWLTAINLPVERFRKAGRATVWGKSMRKVNKRKRK